MSYFAIKSRQQKELEEKRKKISKKPPCTNPPHHFRLPPSDKSKEVITFGVCRKCSLVWGFDNQIEDYKYSRESILNDEFIEDGILEE